MPVQVKYLARETQQSLGWLEPTRLRCDGTHTNHAPKPCGGFALACASRKVVHRLFFSSTCLLPTQQCRSKPDRPTKQGGRLIWSGQVSRCPTRAHKKQRRQVLWITETEAAGKTTSQEINAHPPSGPQPIIGAAPGGPPPYMSSASLPPRPPPPLPTPPPLPLCGCCPTAAPAQ